MVSMFQVALRGATLEATLRSHWAPRTYLVSHVDTGLFAELISCAWDLLWVSSVCLHLLQPHLSLGALVSTHHLLFSLFPNELL